MTGLLVTGCSNGPVSSNHRRRSFALAGKSPVTGPVGGPSQIVMLPLTGRLGDPSEVFHYEFIEGLALSCSHL